MTTTVRPNGLVTVSSPAKHRHLLTTGLWNLLLRDRQTDLSFKTEDGRIIRAHQLIVEIFLSTEKFGGRPRDASDLSTPSRPHWMGDDDVACLLEFLYNGTVTVHRHRLDGLLEVAEELGFDLLVEAATAALKHPQSKYHDKGTQTFTEARANCHTQTIVSQPSYQTSDVAAQTCAIKYPSTVSIYKRVSNGTWIKSDNHLKTDHNYVTDNATQSNETVESSVDTTVDPSPNTTHDPFPNTDAQLAADAPTSVASATNRRRCKRYAKGPPAPFLRCRHCPFRTKMYRLLHNHERNHVEHEARKAPVFACPRCRAHCFSSSYLRYHARSCKEIARCPHCPFTNTNLIHFNKHVSRHGPDGSGFPCPWCTKTLADRASADEHEVVRHSLLTCDQCEGFSTRSRHHYQIHRRDVHDEILARTVARQCPGCEVEFPNIRLLHEHVRIEHPGVKIFPCPLCSKKFINRVALRHHCMKHAGGLKYVCEFCGKRFLFPTMLLKHRMTHSDDKPFVCDTCAKTFKCKQSFRMHVRRHVANVKNYVCEHCGLAFNRSTNLRTHMRIHENKTVTIYPCDECPYKYKTRHALDNHIERWHSGPPELRPRFEEMIACHKCDRQFTERCYYLKHMRTHAAAEGQGPVLSYACPLCDKRFSRRGNLVIHTNKVHLLSLDNLELLQ